MAKCQVPPVIPERPKKKSTPQTTGNKPKFKVPPKIPPKPEGVTESGLSYEPERPQLVFAEEGVDLVALYKEIDNAHINRFSVIHEIVYLESKLPTLTQI